ncbi:MAG TPA: hypothetical protein VL463_01430 [Kofleriaceae bacterium]|nr:hypothetical protein [Kofleriaceae bacterium]
MKFPRPKLPRTADDWRELAPVLLLVAFVGLLAWVYSPAFGGEVCGDDNTFHFADAVRMRQALGDHDWDFWSPMSNNGYALGYYYQFIPSFLPALGSWITGGSILWWFQLGVFLPFVLAPLATYRGVRMMGATPWQALGAAIAVSMFTGNSKWGGGSEGTFWVGLYTQGWALSVFPLALGHGMRWIREGKSLGSAAFWSVFVGLCHPVAGVAIGIALFAGECARWLGFGWRAIWPFIEGPKRRDVRLAITAVVAGAILWLVYKYWLDLFVLIPMGRWQWLALTIALFALIESILHLLREDVAAFWSTPPPAYDGPRPTTTFIRLVMLGVLLIIGSAPAWLPVFVDYVGYGGFPHRVAGEEGWHMVDLKDAIGGHLLDHDRALGVLTLGLPLVALFARAIWLRTLWAASILYFALMELGPYIPKGRDDNFPAVRVLGAMQVCLALAIGAGFVVVVSETRKAIAKRSHELWLRELLGAIGGIFVFALVFSGAQVIHTRVRSAWDFPDFHREELDDLWPVMARQTQGRQQVRAGAEAHWSNLLPYAYAGRPAMLQMGGAALQSSPTYVYQWEQQDIERSAYIYDAPYVLLKTEKENEVPGGVVIGQTDHYELKMFDAPGLIVPVHVVGVLPPGRWPARDEGVKWIKGDQPMKDETYAFDGYGVESAPPQGIVIAYSWQPSPGDAPDYTAELEASAPTTFELKISWHPRWEATLDGKPIKLGRVLPDFLAVDVPKGRHHLELRFHRPLWAWLVWFLWPAVAIAGWRVTSRGRAASA